MEFFRGFYDGDRIGRLIRALKQLQDNLGDFNDYEVQRANLRQLAEDMISGRPHRRLQPAATLTAMGWLVEHLENGQANERKLFQKRFGGFAREQNRHLARDLFAR